MRARTHLIRIQRDLYNRLNRYARRLMGELSSELKKYFIEYQKDFQDFKEVSSKRELQIKLQRAHIILCGDYHTLAQAQKTVIRLLRDTVPALRRRNKEVVLALEMARPRDDKPIARYLKGKLSTAKFLKTIGFAKNWGFSWANYEKLFAFARDHEMSVVGINSGAGKTRALRERDKYAARIIADLSKKSRNRIVFVLVGDLHLASSHLPKQLDRELRRQKLDRRTLVIHQNNERFYWKLVDRGLEQKVDVVKVKNGVYCVMNTPPWVKVQSHLRWAEMMWGEGASGKSTPQLLPSESLGYAELFQEVDHTEEVSGLVAAIEKFCGLKPRPADRFNVQGPSDLSFLLRARKVGRFSASEVAVLRLCLSEFPSFFIPRMNLVYLTTPSLNQAAEQAARYLHADRSGFDRLFSQPQRDFYSFVWVEALGFLGSKIINPKRKCDGPQDLRQVVDKKSIETKPGLARWVLRHWEQERRFVSTGGLSKINLPKAVTPERAVFYYRAARVLGHLLGHGLYTAVVDNQIDREELILLFENPFTDSKQAKHLYLQYGLRLDAFHYRQVIKTERL